MCLSSCEDSEQKVWLRSACSKGKEAGEVMLLWLRCVAFPCVMNHPFSLEQAGLSSLTVIPDVCPDRDSGLGA